MAHILIGIILISVTLFICKSNHTMRRMTGIYIGLVALLVRLCEVERVLSMVWIGVILLVHGV